MRLQFCQACFDPIELGRYLVFVLDGNLKSGSDSIAIELREGLELALVQGECHVALKIFLNSFAFNDICKRTELFQYQSASKLELVQDSLSLAVVQNSQEVLIFIKELS